MLNNKKHAKRIFDDGAILNLLGYGLSFQEINHYLNLQDFSFDTYLKVTLPKTLYTLYPKISGQTLLTVYQQVRSNNLRRFMTLRQEIGYWFLLHLMVIGMMIFYKWLIFPAITDQVIILNGRLNVSWYSKLCIQFIVITHVCCLITLVCFSFIILNKKTRMVTAAYLYTHKYCKILNLCISEQFALYYRYFYPETKTTLMTIKTLRKAHTGTLAGSIAFEIERRLEYGEDILAVLKQSSMHQTFQNYLREGFYMNSLEQSLDKGLTIANILIQAELKKWFCRYRVFVTMNILMIVVSYYELIMIPLKLMEGL